MMSAEISTFRLYLMRALYLMNFVGLGVMVWPELIGHRGVWDPLHGVAYSFWAALSALMGVGIRYPLKMLPVLFMQLTYKSIWLAAVMLPAWLVGRHMPFTRVFIMGAVADLIVIPWPYVLANYIQKRGDRWRSLPEPVLAPSRP